MRIVAGKLSKGCGGREAGLPHRRTARSTGVRKAAEELRSMAGRQIPMELTPASAGRRPFTIAEPIGGVAAISAFNHPLNLIVHQVVPAIAVGCPAIVKPALPTPLAGIEFVRLVHEAGLPPASGVMVNDHTTFRTDWMPFAGRRQSVYGIGGVPWTMGDMTQEKMVVFRM